MSVSTNLHCVTSQKSKDFYVKSVCLRDEYRTAWQNITLFPAVMSRIGRTLSAGSLSPSLSHSLSLTHTHTHKSYVIIYSAHEARVYVQVYTSTPRTSPPTSPLHPNITPHPIQDLPKVHQLVETNLQHHPYTLLFLQNTTCCMHINHLPINC
jgi:hypothetical protein